MKRWSPKFKTYWCVVDRRGTAMLVSARLTRTKSIKAFLDDADKFAGRGGWPWWRRLGYVCQRCDIKVRTSQS